MVAETLGQKLLAELSTVEGNRLIIRKPDEPTRRKYRRAIHDVRSNHLLADDMMLRYTGRNAGDIRISLEPRDVPKPARAPVRVPKKQGAEQAVVRDLTRRSDLPVSSASRPRALLILQALADEAERRGYKLVPSKDYHRTAEFVIGESRIPIALREIMKPGPEVSIRGARASGDPWLREQLLNGRHPTGRLSMNWVGGWPTRRWRDMKRWRLEDKLPDVLSFAEGIAAEHRRRADEAAARRAAERKRWEEAVPVAEQRLLREHNLARLRNQASASTEAAGIRRYCDLLAAAITTITDAAQAQAATDWMGWARDQANLIDPLNWPEHLTYKVPAGIPRGDLDKYMPAGLTALYPPR